MSKEGTVVIYLKNRIKAAEIHIEDKERSIIRLEGVILGLKEALDKVKEKE